MDRTHDRVEQAMHAVPRTLFLPAAQRSAADIDAPLPIGEGQTNSQPFTVATMLRLLEAQPGDRVLDVGAGSGWTTALLARLVGTDGAVIGVERQKPLIDPARRALEAAGCEDRASIRLTPPGVLGAPDEGPFDRILVSAEARRLPQTLLEQLADAGVMVIPVAGAMHRIERHGAEIRDTEHGGFRFVPLVEE